MLTITYFGQDEIADSRFRYAVMVSHCAQKWVFVRQDTKQTYELPAGRREPGETILETARRELSEETGATRYTLKPICAFGVHDDAVPAVPDAPCGMLYLADIQERGPLPAVSEIGEVILSDRLPEKLSYPEIQPRLFQLAASFLV